MTHSRGTASASDIKISDVPRPRHAVVKPSDLQPLLCARTGIRNPPAYEIRSVRSPTRDLVHPKKGQPCWLFAGFSWRGRQPAGHRKRNDNQLRGRPRRWRGRGKTEEEKGETPCFFARPLPEHPRSLTSALRPLTTAQDGRGRKRKGKVVCLLAPSRRRAHSTGAGRGPEPSPPRSGQGRGRRRLGKAGARTPRRGCVVAVVVDGEGRGACAEAASPLLGADVARGHVSVFFCGHGGGRVRKRRRGGVPDPLRCVPGGGEAAVDRDGGGAYAEAASPTLSADVALGCVSVRFWDGVPDPLRCVPGRGEAAVDRDGGGAYAEAASPSLSADVALGCVSVRFLFRARAGGRITNSDTQHLRAARGTAARKAAKGGGRRGQTNVSRT